MCGSARHAAWSPPNRASTSSRVIPSHAPKEISLKASSAVTPSPGGFAISAAVSRARPSGLVYTLAAPDPARARAVRSACTRPAAESGTSRHPWNRRSRFHAVSP